jgi:hypothetical protein
MASEVGTRAARPASVPDRQNRARSPGQAHERQPATKQRLSSAVRSCGCSESSLTQSPAAAHPHDRRRHVVSRLAVIRQVMAMASLPRTGRPGVAMWARGDGGRGSAILWLPGRDPAGDGVGFRVDPGVNNHCGEYLDTNHPLEVTSLGRDDRSAFRDQHARRPRRFAIFACPKST